MLFATAQIVGLLPLGHLAVLLLDGPHAGQTWAMLDEFEDFAGDFRVTYYPDDQFVTPVGGGQ